MKRSIFAAASVCVALAAPQISTAGELSGKISTLGAGIEYRQLFTPLLAARIGVNAFSYDDSITESGLKYDAELDLKSLSLLTDYHPWGGSFHITGGVLYNGSKLSITAEPSAGGYTFNDVTYSAADVGSATGEIDFQKFAPYIGLGWRTNGRGLNGVTFSADIGAIYQGSPETTLTASCGSLLTASACTQLKNDVAAEQKQLEESIKDLQWYPVVSVGIGFRF